MLAEKLHVLERVFAALKDLPCRGFSRLLPHLSHLQLMLLTHGWQHGKVGLGCGAVLGHVQLLLLLIVITMPMLGERDDDPP
jgi:hypothetical protein